MPRRFFQYNEEKWFPFDEMFISETEYEQELAVNRLYNQIGASWDDSKGAQIEVKQADLALLLLNRDIYRADLIKAVQILVAEGEIIKPMLEVDDFGEGFHKTLNRRIRGELSRA